VKLVAVGQAPVGVIAIGQVPVGVLAIGQGARGLIAIGQLACGAIAVGQLAVGLVAFGQLALGGVWSGGMLALAPVGGPSLIGWGPLGQLGLRDLYRLRWGRFRAAARTPVRITGAAIIAVVAALIVWFGSLSPIVDELRRDDDRTDIEEPVLR
jgi:hypothetical protein